MLNAKIGSVWLIYVTQWLDTLCSAMDNQAGLKNQRSFSSRYLRHYQNLFSITHVLTDNSTISDSKSFFPILVQ